MSGRPRGRQPCRGLFSLTGGRRSGRRSRRHRRRRSRRRLRGT
jgi:hypothetical protein